MGRFVWIFYAMKIKNIKICVRLVNKKIPEGKQFITFTIIYYLMTHFYTLSPLLETSFYDILNGAPDAEKDALCRMQSYEVGFWLLVKPKTNKYADCRVEGCAIA